MAALLTTETTPHQYEDEIDLLRYGRFLAAYWMVLLGGALAGTLAGLALPQLMPARYRATAGLTLSQQPGAPPNNITLAAARAAFLANLTVVTETINELGLKSDGVTTQSFVTDSLEIQVPAPNLVTLSVTLPDPTKARLAAALLANKLVDLNRSANQQAAAASRDSLEKDVAKAEANLDAAEQRLVAFQTTADIEMRRAASTSSSRRSAELGVALEIALDAEWARLVSLEQQLARQPVDRRIDSPPVPRQSGAGAEQPATVPNPVYSMLQYDIAQTRLKISRLEQHWRDTSGTQGVAAAAARKALYQRRLELARLQAQFDANLRIYTDLAIRYQDERDRGTRFASQLQILDAPVQPDRPVARHRAQFGMLGGLIGLFAGVVAALLMNRRAAAIALPAHA